MLTTNEVRTGYPYELGAEDPFAMPPPVSPPCPLCSGQVDPDDPAAQALAWGVRVAESTPGASDFWKTMMAAEMYRNADLGFGLGDSDARDVMDKFVSQGLDAAIEQVGVFLVDDAHLLTTSGAGSEAGVAGWSAALASYTGESDDWWEELLKWWEDVGRWEYIYRVKLLDTDTTSYTQMVQGGGGSISSDLWSGPERCKVEVFWYPVFWYPKPATSGEGAYYYGFRFGAGLVYLDTPGLYDCACCVFRQFRQATKSTRDHTNQPLMPNASWTRDAKGGRQYRGGRVCTDPSKDDPTKEGGTYYGESECIFYFEDTPLAWLKVDGRHTSTWDFIGIVYDRCKKWTVRAVKRLVAYRSITAEGGVPPFWVTDTPGSPLLFRDVGPISQREAVEEARPGGAPGESMPPMDPKAPKRLKMPKAPWVPKSG